MPVGRDGDSALESHHAPPPRATVLLQGSDGLGPGFWSWEWNDGTEPGFVVVERDATTTLLDAFEETLPGAPVDAVPDIADLLALVEQMPQLGPHLLVTTLDLSTGTAVPQPTAPERVRSTLGVVRALTGPLAHRDGERRLSGHLSRLLLPSALVEEIRLRTGPAGTPRPLMRILPAPLCHAVPWELLLTVPGAQPGEDKFDERLIDLVDVVTVAPPLTRDGAENVGDRTTWESVAGLDPLRVIDPDDSPAPGGANASRRVLTTPESQGWRDRAAPSDQIRANGTAKSWLSRTLTSGSFSRLFYLGHVGVTRPLRGVGEATLQLGREADAGDVRPNRQTVRPPDERLLTASEMFLASGAPRFGPQREQEGGPVSVPGSTGWPMPPRVAFFACTSGTDLAGAEPFGLVVAAMESGAELVTATRWALPTDRAFELLGVDQKCLPFNAAALEVDDMQAGADPIAGLCDWQRRQLALWRSSGRLEHSPLVWAALTNFHAPMRTVPTPAEIDALLAATQTHATGIETEPGAEAHRDPDTDPSLESADAPDALRSGIAALGVGDSVRAERILRHAVSAHLAASLSVGAGQSEANLGTALDRQGRHTEAEKFHRSAYERLRSVPGHEAEAASCLMHLANSLDSRGRLNEAEALYLEALGALEDVPNAETERARCLGNLGSTLQALGRLEEAEAHQRAAADALAAIDGLDSDLGVCLTTLGTTLYHLKRPDEAIEVYTQAVELMERASTPEQFLFSGILNLANVLISHRQHDEARSRYEDLLERARELPGAETTVANCLMNLGTIELIEQRPTSAIKRYEEAMIAWGRVEDAHQQLAECSSNLARALGAAGRIREAKELLAPAALFVDSVRHSLASTERRRAWTDNIAAVIVRGALQMAAHDGDARLLADLIALTRASGVLAPDTGFASSQADIEEDAENVAEVETAPGFVTGPSLVASAAVLETLGMGRRVQDLRLSPTPWLQMPDGRIALLHVLAEAADRFRMDVSGLVHRGTMRL